MARLQERSLGLVRVELLATDPDCDARRRRPFEPLDLVKILVVEDEPKAAAYLRQGLEEAGFVVDVAPDGTVGSARARSEAYALIVCDVMLPGQDGFALVRQLREAGRHTPVLFVTARDEVDAKVRGFGVGGDDYLVKPFAFAELLARVRALLRRVPERAPEIYAVGDLVCDIRTRRVERGGRRVDLTPKEFALLQFLMERAGEVVSRTLIADRVWDMNFDSDTNVIDVQIRRLRTKIDAPSSVPLLHTVRGVGYVLEERGSNSTVPSRTASDAHD